VVPDGGYRDEAREEPSTTLAKIFVWDAWVSKLGFDDTEASSVKVGRGLRQTGDIPVIGRVELKDDDVADAGIEAVGLERVAALAYGDGMDGRRRAAGAAGDAWNGRGGCQRSRRRRRENVASYESAKKY